MSGRLFPGGFRFSTAQKVSASCQVQAYLDFRCLDVVYLFFFFWAVSGCMSG